MRLDKQNLYLGNKSYLDFTSTDSSVPVNFISPSFAERTAYQTVSVIIGFIDIYLLLTLCFYEKSCPCKPPGGKKLRILCVLAASVAVFHQILQQIIVASAYKSTTASCFTLMLLKTTALNLIVSLTYGFLWLRQHTLYSSPRLQHLRSNKLNFITWIALGLIMVNPLLVFGFQFSEGLYETRDGVCLLLPQNLSVVLPLNLVSFSYAFIQVTLLVMYFYPLCKNISSKKKEIKSIALTEDYKPNKIMDTLNNPRIEISSAKSTLSGQTIERKRNEKKNSIAKCLKKWIALSLICILTDIGSASVILIFWLVYSPASLISRPFLFLWHDVSMVINVVCMVGCFNDNLIMLFPFRCMIKEKRKQPQNLSSARESTKRNAKKNNFNKSKCNERA